jgi:hypothetical protein
MKQEDAKREIIAVPKEQRQTEAQASAFAMLIKDKYKFRGGTADPYQTINAWLCRDMSLTRGLD